MAPRSVAMIAVSSFEPPSTTMISCVTEFDSVGTNDANVVFKTAPALRVGIMMLSRSLSH